ncbi:RluA family pseudouridine synthase [Desulfurispira natronophila]|uniref:Pseudouridine synthase n=1 Tax=Desulfurispira natronophila TaxID=682562 RepID=A0A7W8DGC5_9BACT|nr:RluA family pseudouridine synthase [Desulfurispira natronophila]MBB5021093.1 23S rRNA pseudouridine1911/1915/1917 synthase [Desulfurispira natronophila]
MSAKIIRLYVESDPQRLDRYIAIQNLVSRTMASRLIGEGRVTLNGTVVTKTSLVPALGDEILVHLQPPRSLAELKPQAIKLDILYEDSDLLAINKPAGMVVHPAPGNPDNTLVNALIHYLGDDLRSIGGVLRPGIVHRLDKDTSGVMLAAKSEIAHQRLVEMLSDKQVHRSYLALCHGSLPDKGVVEGQLGRDPKDRKKIAVLPEGRGRYARTTYQTIARYEVGGRIVSLLCCVLDTGRTHQIRVHLRSLQRPMLGDQVYGQKKEPPFVSMKRQALHSERVCFQHPVSGAQVDVRCPIPEDMQWQLDKLVGSAKI